MNSQDYYNRDVLIRHISELDGVIRRRNEIIAGLRKELKDIREKPVDLGVEIEKQIESAYRKGWRDCYSNVANVARGHYLNFLQQMEIPVDKR